MTTAVLDPFDAATEAGNRPDAFFGRMEVDAQFVKLKGGKRPWTEDDDVSDRCTEVIFRLNPLDVTNMTRMIERGMIAEYSEWSKIAWPSLRDLDVKNVREINGKWAHVELVKSGRSWKNKDNETVQGTTFKFMALFDSEADCIAAWETVFSNGGSQQRETGSAPGSNSAPTSTPQADDANKAVAEQFLPALVKMANGDLDVLANTLATTEIVKNYFTIDSPEVQKLVLKGGVNDD